MTSEHLSTSNLFTSESVTEGHPDKIADQISDAILDECLRQDPLARVAAETLLSGNHVIVAGELSTLAKVDFDQVVRGVIQQIGYDAESKGLDYRTCQIQVLVGQQSPDISRGVTAGQGLAHQQEQGAGDQGLMFGYAVRESATLMPYTLDYAHKLAQKLAEVRKNGRLPWLRPDGKTQVTFQYETQAVGGGVKGEWAVPKRCDAIVVSAQHDPEVSYEEIQAAIRAEVIEPVVPAEWRDAQTRIYINPTGRFVVGGPAGDCGLTGRKIIVDTYGGHGAHGGGAFSGKDPSKVDRTACYMARYVAKNIVAAGLATRCLVQLAYAIGVAEPVGVMVETFGTETVARERLQQAVNQTFALTPAGMVASLNLLRPIYRKTAAYGHFGRLDPDFHWEKLDHVAALQALL